MSHQLARGTHNDADAESAGGAPTDSASETSTKPKANRGRPFDPGNPEKNGEETVSEGQGFSDPTIISDVDVVKSDLATFRSATGQRAVAINGLLQAEADWEPVRAKVEDALVPVGALLCRVIEGGRQLYADCDDHDMWTKASKLIAHMPPGDLGLNPALMSALRTEVAGSLAQHQLLADAKATKVAADRAWTAARKNLELSIRVLKRCIQAVKLREARRSSGRAGPPEPIPTPVPKPIVTPPPVGVPHVKNGHSNGKANGRNHAA